MARLRRRTLQATKVTGWSPDKRCEIFPENPDRPDLNDVDIEDVKRCASECGSHWFEKGTMRFFQSRVSGTAFADGRGGAYFSSSEKGPTGPRLYSVRYYDPDRCGIETIGEFQQYRTSAQARSAAKRAAAGQGLGRFRRRRRR